MVMISGLFLLGDFVFGFGFFNLSYSGKKIVDIVLMDVV